MALLKLSPGIVDVLELSPATTDKWLPTEVLIPKLNCTSPPTIEIDADSKDLARSDVRTETPSDPPAAWLVARLIPKRSSCNASNDDLLA